jgi:hypothetical protein
VQAATLISSALQSMGWGSNPWAGLGSGPMRRKPHKASDRAVQALLDAQKRDGKLRLAHFRSLRQAALAALAPAPRCEGTHPLQY